MRIKKLISLISSTYGVFIIIILLGAYGELQVERGVEGASICTYGDALWFALNVSSVGDASCTPVTVAGRIIGAGLILIGYTLFAINVAALSSMISHYLNNHNSSKKEN